MTNPHDESPRTSPPSSKPVAPDSVKALPPPEPVKALPPADPDKSGKPPARHRSGKVVWIVGTIVVILLALQVWRLVKRPKPERQRPSVPVSVAPARTGELKVYLTALGPVTAWNTVTVHSRVDGQLLSVKFTEGQRVKEGDLLAEIDPRQFEAALEQSKGQLAKDQAQLTNAKRDLERYQQAQEAVTEQQVGAARAAAAEAEGTVQTDQAMVDNNELQLSYTKITAPIPGVVGLRQVDAGNLVHASDPNGLVVITQDRPIAVIFSLPEGNLPQVKQASAGGQKLVVDAYDSGMTTKLETGEVAAIDNQIDPATGTVKMKAQFTNEKGALFPNQFVNVRLLVETREDVVLVPAPAVQIGPQNRFVFVVKPDHTVEQRVVTVGQTEDETVEITKGLSAGESVVTEGLDKLRNGAAVTLQAPPGAGGKEEDASPAKPRKPGSGRKKGS